ncbi:MAG: hypothetical protein EOP87_08555 [Verrucomicrobiaceae bacterium]|nr:MAG: hypothetical protein EOP87_08555 [Verrucomicrobiaceae bacterium]
MKAMPTLEGGLRIDTEDASDWELLRSIIVDANGTRKDLASRLGGLISEEAGAEDWQEYVVPDLREAFQDELAQVGASIESAVFEADGQAGPIWITPEDASPWYSALNQARLSIEEQFHFGPSETIDLTELTPERRAAFIRSKFYCAIQGLLLEYVMR